MVDLQWLESGEMPPEDLDSLSRNLAFHLKRLVDERDTQLEVMTYAYHILFCADVCLDVCCSPNKMLLMKIMGSARVMWKLFPFFAITTKEQPQEGRVETVNCLMDEEWVCFRVYASLNEFPTHRVQMLATDS